MPARIAARLRSLAGRATAVASLASASAVLGAGRASARDLIAVPADGGATTFGVAALLTAAGAAAASVIISRAAAPYREGRLGVEDPILVAWLRGGDAHAARTALVGVMEALRGRVDAETGLVRIGSPDGAIPPYLVRFRRAVLDGMTGAQALAGVRAALGDVRGRLVSMGHLPPPDHAFRTTLAATACMLPALLAAGMGFLGSPDPSPGGAIASIGAALVTLCVLVSAAERDGAGAALVERVRAANSRAARAPLPGEVAFAYSLVGPDTLAGTSLAALRPAFQPRKARPSRSGATAGDSGGSDMTALGWYGDSLGCDSGHSHSGGDGGHSGGSDGGHGGGHGCSGGHSCGSSCGSSCGGH